MSGHAAGSISQVHWCVGVHWYIMSEDEESGSPTLRLFVLKMSR